ncbi:Uncharacterised protein [Serratia plymuthica]|uniref:Uncharacterized protein n=1 Tax=Serratia plymuthica TaxID=82996 RepID=A0A2X4VH83_SERPL|nr:Uncharacterised protein [Serratia plymuthica]
MDMFFYHLTIWRSGEICYLKHGRWGWIYKVTAFAPWRTAPPQRLQLRHWWQQTLPQAVLREGCLEQPEVLTHALRQWRSSCQDIFAYALLCLPSEFCSI